MQKHGKALDDKVLVQENTGKHRENTGKHQKSSGKHGKTSGKHGKTIKILGNIE